MSIVRDGGNVRQAEMGERCLSLRNTRAASTTLHDGKQSMAGAEV